MQAIIGGSGKYVISNGFNIVASGTNRKLRNLFRSGQKEEVKQLLRKIAENSIDDGIRVGGGYIVEF